jgi:uncharacterized protein
MNLLRIILLFACCVVVFQTQAGYGNSIDIPPIDCAKPTDKLDAEICADKAMKEWWLETLYRDALTLHPEHRDAINAAQQEWIVLRDQCADPEATLACVYALYDERTNAVLDESIQPLWLDSAANPAQTLANFRSLTSPLAKLYAELLTHALSGESIAAFSTFAESLAERVDSEVWENGPAIVLPCGLVEKYPRLLLLARPALDSAKDVPLPAIETYTHTYAYCRWEPGPDLVTDFLKTNPLALANWFERCQIQDAHYWYYARYDTVVDERRRYFPRSYLTDELTSTHEPERPWPTSQEIETWYSDPDYRKAQVALATYYLLHFRLTQEESETAAARALWDNRNTMDDPSMEATTACLREE